MGWAVHPFFVLTADLLGLLSLLLWVLIALRNKSLKAIVLFLFPLHVFFQVFCPREKYEFHWKIGSCNVWLGIRSTPLTDLPL